MIGYSMCIKLLDLKLIDKLVGVAVFTIGYAVFRYDIGELIGIRFSESCQPIVINELDVQVLLDPILAFQDKAAKCILFCAVWKKVWDVSAVGS